MNNLIVKPHAEHVPAVETVQGEIVGPEDDQQPPATAQAPAGGETRYEQLVHAARAFIFTVMIKDGQAARTIHYPGVVHVTGYTEQEYTTQPQLWYQIILDEDKAIVLQQIAQLMRGEYPPPITHRIIHKNGSVRWLRNTSVPVFDDQDKLIAYDGLVVDISDFMTAEAEKNRQLAELESARDRVKTLHGLLPVCFACKTVRNDKDYWQNLKTYLSEYHSDIKVTDSLCPACAQSLPEYCRQINVQA